MGWLILLFLASRARSETQTLLPPIGTFGHALSEERGVRSLVLVVLRTGSAGNAVWVIDMPGMESRFTTGQTYEIRATVNSVERRFRGRWNGFVFVPASELP